MGKQPVRRDRPARLCGVLCGVLCGAAVQPSKFARPLRFDFSRHSAQALQLVWKIK